ncbi:MAG: hypothetical protein U0V70_07465 [Terriglobia bacterium]
MKFKFLLGVWLLGMITQSAFAQQPVEPKKMYERLFCIVPLIGSGTFEDPRRPAYLPDYVVDPGSQAMTSQNLQSVLDQAALQQESPHLILSFHYVESDDGRFALMEIQATDREAFAPILKAAQTPGSSPDFGSNRNALPGGYDLRVFEAGKVNRLTVEQQFRQFKRDFLIDNF